MPLFLTDRGPSVVDRRSPRDQVARRARLSGPYCSALPFRPTPVHQRIYVGDHLGMAGPSDLARRRDALNELLAIAGAHGDPGFSLQARNNLSTGSLADSDLKAARFHVEQQIELVSELGLRARMWTTGSASFSTSRVTAASRRRFSGAHLNRPGARIFLCTWPTWPQRWAP